MSNSQMGSVAIGLLVSILSCLGLTDTQHTGDVPFVPAHATDYGFGGQRGPLTFNGHMVPDTVNDSPDSGSSHLSNPQPQLGLQPANIRQPCSTSTTTKQCSSSKKRCWLVKSPSGSVPLGPTVQRPGETPGQSVGGGTLVGPGGQQVQGWFGFKVQKGQTFLPGGAGHQIQQPYMPGGTGQTVQQPFMPGGAGQTVPQPFISGGAGQTVQQPFMPGGPGQTVQQPFMPGGVGQTVQQPFMPGGVGQTVQQPFMPGGAGQTVQQPFMPGGAGQTVQQPFMPGGAGQTVQQPFMPGGAGQPGQPASAITGHVQYPATITSPYGYKLKPVGFGQPGSAGSLQSVSHHGISSVGTGQYGSVVGSSPQTSGIGVTGTGQSTGYGQPKLGIGQTASIGQFGGAGTPHWTGSFGFEQQVGGQVGTLGQVGVGQPQTAGLGQPSGVGQGRVTDHKIKQYVGGGIGLQQPTLHQTGTGQTGTNGQLGGMIVGHMSKQPQTGNLGQSGQNGQLGGAGYRPSSLSIKPSFPAGSNGQQGQGHPGQTQTSPTLGNVQIGQGAKAQMGYLVWVPTQQGAHYPPGTHVAPQPHQQVGYPAGSKAGAFPQSSFQPSYPSGPHIKLQHVTGHPSGSHITPQNGMGYPAGSKIIVQQSVGHSTSTQTASQQGVGYPSGSQVISQQGTVYPFGSKLSHTHPNLQTASQQTIGYPGGSQVGVQPGTTYPVGPRPPQHYGIGQPVGAHGTPQLGIRDPTGTKFGLQQRISQPNGPYQGIQPPGTASQVPFYQGGGYPTGPYVNTHYPSGPQSAHTTSNGQSPTGQMIHPQLTNGQGWQQPQYPGGGLMKAQTHGQPSSATLILPPLPAGFRYSVKPK